MLLATGVGPASHLEMIRSYCWALALLMACGEGTDQRDERNLQDESLREPVTSVYLRLRNTSNVSFDTILVRVTQTIDFGTLPAGATSQYLQADGILHVRAQCDGPADGLARHLHVEGSEAGVSGV
jgi:hypothetical protein